MTNLEFIEKEIELTKDVIENTQEALSDSACHEVQMYCYFNKEEIQDRLNEAKKRLKTLQNIKSKLEKLETIKKYWTNLHCDTFTGAIIKLQNIPFTEWEELSEYLQKEVEDE